MAEKHFSKKKILKAELCNLKNPEVVFRMIKDKYTDSFHDYFFFVLFNRGNGNTILGYIIVYEKDIKDGGGEVTIEFYHLQELACCPHILKIIEIEKLTKPSPEEIFVEFIAYSRCQCPDDRKLISMRSIDSDSRDSILNLIRNVIHGKTKQHKCLNNLENPKALYLLFTDRKVRAIDGFFFIASYKFCSEEEILGCVNVYFDVPCTGNFGIQFKGVLEGVYRSFQIKEIKTLSQPFLVKLIFTFIGVDNKEYTLELRSKNAKTDSDLTYFYDKMNKYYIRDKVKWIDYRQPKVPNLDDGNVVYQLISDRAVRAFTRGYFFYTWFQYGNEDMIPGFLNVYEDFFGGEKVLGVQFRGLFERKQYRVFPMVVIRKVSRITLKNVVVKFQSRENEECIIQLECVDGDGLDGVLYFYNDLYQRRARESQIHLGLIQNDDGFSYAGVYEAIQKRSVKASGYFFMLSFQYGKDKESIGCLYVDDDSPITGDIHIKFNSLFGKTFEKYEYLLNEIREINEISSRTFTIVFFHMGEDRTIKLRSLDAESHDGMERLISDLKSRSKSTIKKGTNTIWNFPNEDDGIPETYYWHVRDELIRSGTSGYYFIVLWKSNDDAEILGCLTVFRGCPNTGDIGLQLKDFSGETNTPYSHILSEITNVLCTTEEIIIMQFRNDKNEEYTLRLRTVDTASQDDLMFFYREMTVRRAIQGLKK